VSTGATVPADLIERVARRDRQAFNQLYDRFAPLVYSLALRMLKAPADAEDLLQDVFVQLRVAHCCRFDILPTISIPGDLTLYDQARS
jgi:DNA-directed RNA polymerase specialized sigma subunit